MAENRLTDSYVSTRRNKLITRIGVFAIMPYLANTGYIPEGFPGWPF